MPSYKFIDCQEIDSETVQLTYTYEHTELGHTREISIIGKQKKSELSEEEYSAYKEALFADLINFMENYWKDSYQIPDSDYRVHESDSYRLDGDEHAVSWKDYVLTLEEPAA